MEEKEGWRRKNECRRLRRSRRVLLIQEVRGHSRTSTGRVNWSQSDAASPSGDVSIPSLHYDANAVSHIS